jgi:hypothetical protein
MPEFARFYGLVCVMYYREPEHQGLPHFHVRGGDAQASFGIDPMVLLAGGLARPQLALIIPWAARHRAELLANWNRRGAGLPLAPLAFP